MIDAHVHLEKGDYSVEWINQFVAYAVKRNIDKVYFWNILISSKNAVISIMKCLYIMNIRRIGIRKNGNRHVL